MSGGLIPGWPLDPDRPALGSSPAPDRPRAPGLLAPRARAAAVTLVALGCGLLAVQILVTGFTSGGLADGLLWAAFAVVVGIRAWLLWRVVDTLRTAPGRYAFVLDQRQVEGTSHRWWLPALRFAMPRWNGWWLQLADAETEELLGWFEVSPAAARHLDGQLVVAVWGWEPGARHVALSGRFPCVEVVGAVHPDEPIAA